jgi:hypothetical protein
MVHKLFEKLENLLKRLFKKLKHIFFIWMLFESLFIKIITNLQVEL